MGKKNKLSSLSVTPASPNYQERSMKLDALGYAKGNLLKAKKIFAWLKGEAA